MPQYTTKQDFPTILFSHPTWSTVEYSSGIFFLIRVHNYTRIKGLDSGKIIPLHSVPPGPAQDLILQPQPLPPQEA